jgi:O-antigen ligase
MFGTIKTLVFEGVPLALYLGIFIVALIGAIRNVRWAFLLLTVLVALPTVWYKVHEFPLGHVTFDVLFAGCLLGVITNAGGFDRAPNGRLIMAAIIVSYVALWNTSLRFGLALPITLDNPVLPEYKNYTEMLLLYFIAYNVAKEEQQQRTIVITMGLVLLFICVHEIRNFSAGSTYLEDRRSVGPFWIVGLGANHFGAFIANFGAVMVGLFLVDRGGYRRWLFMAIVPCLIYPLFNAYSRGAYAGAIAALMVFGVLRTRLILVGLAVFAFCWQFVLPTPVVERILMTGTSTTNLEDSAATRLLLWEKAKQLFADNPVFGIGYNGFGVSVRIAGLNNVHNYYMQIACEQGVIGLALLGSLLLFAFLSGVRLYRIGTTTFSRGLGLGFAGCVAAESITNIFGDRWSYLNIGAYFWIFWGLVDRAAKLSASSAATAPPLAAAPIQGPAAAGPA